MRRPHGRNEDKTLRQAAASYRVRSRSTSGSVPPTTSRARWARPWTKSAATASSVAPAGFNRRFITEFTDGLSPALRRRGLIRDGFDAVPFRDNLLAF